MNNITPKLSTSRRNPTKTTFKPLQDLKFAFTQQSHATSVKGQVSNELPVIKTDSTKKRDLRTQTLSYTDVIDRTLKINLKIAQIHDEVSLIDLKILESSNKFQNSNSQHDKFAKSFEDFLTKQYETVSDSLIELEKTENQSAQLKQELQNLRRQITEKSLKIYELEDIWRKYSTSRNFLRHLSRLLSNDKSYTGKFENPNESNASQIDELLEIFKNIGPTDEKFDDNNFKHVTAEKMLQFLSKLKQQNLKILRYKLHYEKFKNIFHCANEFLENNFRANFNEIEKNSRISREKSQKVVVELVMKEKQLENLKRNIHMMQRNPSLHNFIEQLYEKCVKMPALEKSHLEMVKHIENYCHLLLCTLNSFDHVTIQKAIQLTKV
ncbi:uncharacterized protein LOC135831607 [Planococcus citri]|uniref:uncharacterized protein LOC135831607 n=1 Tax=Planococcus citri TaxID=170843 RepID=UPI0031F9CFED